MKNVSWSCDSLPTITLAGHFPMPAQEDRRAYNDPFHALLLIEYEGTMRTATGSQSLQPGDVILMHANVPTYFPHSFFTMKIILV